MSGIDGVAVDGTSFVCRIDVEARSEKKQTQEGFPWYLGRVKVLPAVAARDWTSEVVFRVFATVRRVPYHTELSRDSLLLPPDQQGPSM